MSGLNAITSDALYLPRELEFVCGMDWGHNQPGCIGWAACLPNGRMHVLREWKFTWLADEDIAEGYKKRTKELGVRVRYIAGDPSMWIRDGRSATRGQSRAETFQRAGMPMKKAENAREDGWSRLHSWLRVPMNDAGEVIGEPLLTIDETCRYLRRTIPAQQSAKDHPDDVNTKGDDHGVDMLRYLVMSRPMPTVLCVPEPPVNPMLAAFLAGQAASPVLGRQNVRRAV